MSDSISVRLARTVELDTEGFIQLAAELLEALDDAKCLIPGRLPEGLKTLSNGDFSEDGWVWGDVVRNWVAAKQA